MRVEAEATVADEVAAAKAAAATPRMPHAWGGARIGSSGANAVGFRLAALALAVLPLALLAVARYLQPSSGGLGTHQQLGLPPCSMRLMLGIRCPSCGMTTSWSHFTRGAWSQSLASNPGGFLLALYSLAFAGGSLRAALDGQLPGDGTRRWFVVALLGIALVTLADWITRLLA